MRAHYDEQDIAHPADFYPPDLHAGGELYIDALNALAPDRHVALGMSGVLYGEIPFLSKERYAARFGLAGDAFDQFLSILRVLDTDWVGRANEKANKR